MPKKQEIYESNNIFNDLAEDIGATGFVGSTDIPSLIWLALHSRYFDNLVSMVIFGPSGSGKSFALKTALQFVPDNTYELLHGMSEKALIYSGDLDFKHKHLIVQEAAGLADGNGRTFLRQLLSEGEARYRTVDSIDGELGAKELRIEGPTGLIMTTTQGHLHPEDQSRILAVNIEENEEQVKAVLRAQAEGTKNLVSAERLEEWKTFSAEATGSELNVAIPFGGKLADTLPTSHYRIQRDFKQVLLLIRTCALLHRFSRGRDEEGNILASLDDYKIVHSLISKPLSEGLETSVGPHIREVIDAVHELQTKGHRVKGPISQRMLADHLGRDKAVVSRNVRSAIELGYISNNNPGQGREAKLAPGLKQLGDNRSVLPEPDYLEGLEMQ